MEPMPQSTLTILILVALILSSVTLITVLSAIICLLCMRYRHSNVDSSKYHLPARCSVSLPNRPSPVFTSPSLSSLEISDIIKNSIVPYPQRINSYPRAPKPSLSQAKYHLDSVTVKDEYSSDDQKKHKQMNKHDRNNDTTFRSENRVTFQHHNRQRQEQEKEKLYKPLTTVMFNSRHTPYPPETIAFDQVMRTNLGFSNDNKFDL